MSLKYEPSSEPLHIFVQFAKSGGPSPVVIPKYFRESLGNHNRVSNVAESLLTNIKWLSPPPSLSPSLSLYPSLSLARSLSLRMQCIGHGRRVWLWPRTFDLPLFWITSPYIAHCMGACSAKGS